MRAYLTPRLPVRLALLAVSVFVFLPIAFVNDTVSDWMKVAASGIDAAGRRLNELDGIE